MFHRPLEDFLTEVRGFLEPRWIAAHESWADGPVPVPPSQHMCRYSCLFLKQALQDAGYGDWNISLGRPASPALEGTAEGAFGYLSAEGCWHDHAWLVRDGLVIDITADQYGGPPVVAGVSLPFNYRANFSEEDVAPDLDALKHRVECWLQARPLWTNRPLS